jgi:hypothetical protein
VLAPKTGGNKINPSKMPARFKEKEKPTCTQIPATSNESFKRVKVRTPNVNQILEL